jgi:hypothetical protein
MTKTTKTTKSSKTNKTCNTACGIAGLTSEEAKEWTKELRKAKKTASSKVVADNQTAITPVSNLQLVLGKEANSTAIYVGGTLVTNVVHATLDISAATGFPVMHLEIFNPDILKE